MKRKVPLSLGIFVVLAATALMYGGDAANTSETSIVPEAAPTNAGYRVQVDPVTREFVESPAIPDVSKTYDGASLSDGDFVVEDAPVGGGKMVNLKGQFQHTFSVNAGPHGELTIECDPDDNNGERE